jgi:nicotinate-nucleotide--dimethylbenzimidazole phosphoribosyltransferase
VNLKDWLAISVQPVDLHYRALATERQSQLTKPPGSLGLLEDIAVRLAGLQAVECPSCDRVAISIFAADHGVAKQKVSAFPQEVTTQMILNFASGGAAISVLAQQLNADFEVINLGTVTPVEHPDVVSKVIAASSSDFTETAAMSVPQLEAALNVGADAVIRAGRRGVELFVAGEMGIANTTSASALMAAFLDLSGADVAGSGTGISSQGVQHKAKVIDQALALHRAHLSSPMDILKCLGGFEIAAMVGAYLKAANLGITIVVDGFISTVAAYIAIQINPNSKDWMVFGHCSPEAFHQGILDSLDIQPLLDLGMRLGEGSGAAVAVNIMRTACALHRDMATFADAGVSQ